MITLFAADGKNTLLAPDPPPDRVAPAREPSLDASKSEGTLCRSACEPAFSAMRDELQEYGALLNLLDQQEAAILASHWERLAAVDQLIEVQQSVRRAMSRARRTALSLLLPGGLGPRPFPQIVSLFPAAMRPLAEALATEEARLKKLTDRRLDHNQRLLARARSVRGRV